MRRGILLAAVVTMVAAGCGGAKHVALPGASASPHQIVATYISALDAHDISTARALLTAAHAQYVNRSVDSWFRNVVSINHLRMNEPHNDPYEARLRQYRDCVSMGVTFDLEQH